MEPVPEKIHFPSMEEEVLAFWKKIDAFQTSLKQSEGLPEYSFYDGPPFATGLPHYGHILAGTIKDIVTRFAHQSGYHVTRRFGWDCHGLPIEFEIDKEFHVKTRQDVLKMGIDRYNEACRAIVMRYARDWEDVVTRLGRWIDFRNDYKTMNLQFMESVWWVFKQLYEKKLVYRGFKVMPYSTGCTTPLSNFEASLNYKEVQDPAVFVSFPLLQRPDVALVAWTTTPWTLPSNLALCVNPKLDYVTVFDKALEQQFLLAEARLPELYKDASCYELRGAKVKGQALVGQAYRPLFDYFAGKYPKAFVVLADDYVTADAGTGVVHQAPAFGEDDFRVCLAAGLLQKGEDVPCPVDSSGLFTAEVTDFAGQYVKDADKAIKEKLKHMGRLVRASTLKHQYPFCWRSDTPLIYKAVPSWFVAVEKIKDRLLVNNQKTYWVPAAVKDGRFHNWLQDARDWAVSRNRYWGTPLPIWTSDDGKELVVIGSVQELEERSGVRGIDDIHRHKIDHITMADPRGASFPPLRRVDEVFDCWFESGSMPYGQQHYPFENKELFARSFPADFVAEGLDQTRGWFYTLMVLSTALFDQPAFKNLIVNGLVLAADGKKMSKRLKNYPDPMLVVSKYGADALRLYLINSPVVRAEPLRFVESGVFDVLKDVFLPWFNAYRFFVQNASLAHVELSLDSVVGQLNVMDRWILAACQSLIRFVRAEMAAYRLYTVVPQLVRFVDQLTNWYVRLNRRRLKGDAGAAARAAALNVLFDVLRALNTAMAPFTPFFTEYMHQNLRRALPSAPAADSVHFVPFPTPREQFFDARIEEAVGRMQAVVVLARAVRDRRHLPLKMPLRELVVSHARADFLDDVRQLQAYVTQELNVHALRLTQEESLVRHAVRPDASRLGPRLKGDWPKVRAELERLDEGRVRALLRERSCVVCGHAVSLDEVDVVRQFGGVEAGMEAESNDDVLVVLDCREDDELRAQYFVREFVNRVQKLRKHAGLLPSDELECYYRLDERAGGGGGGGGDDAARLLAARLDAVQAALKLPVRPAAELTPFVPVVASETKEVLKARFVLTLVPAHPHLGVAALRRRLPAESDEFFGALHRYLVTRRFATLRDELLRDKRTVVVLDGKRVELVLDEDVFVAPPPARV